MDKAFMIFLATKPVELPPIAKVLIININCNPDTFHFFLSLSNIMRQKCRKNTQYWPKILKLLNLRAYFTYL